MKKFFFSIFVVLFLTISANAAATVTPISSPSKSFVQKETKENTTYSISQTANETQEWCWVEWTLTLTWSDGTTSSYSGTSGNANGCSAAFQQAYNIMGQILAVVLEPAP